MANGMILENVRDSYCAFIQSCLNLVCFIFAMKTSNYFYYFYMLLFQHRTKVIAKLIYSTPPETRKHLYRVNSCNFNSYFYEESTL